MKKFVIVIGIVVGLFAGGIVALVLNLNGIVSGNRDRILAQAEETLGRRITVESINVGLRGGIGLRLDGITLADDAAFSADPFIEAEALQVNVKFWPLLRKRFEVKRIVLRQPVIRIVRSADGRLNVQSLAASGAETQQPGGAGAAAVAISLLNVEDGEVIYTDAARQLVLRVTRIESEAKDLDPTRPISASVEAALFSEDRNLDLQATIGPIKEDSVAVRMDLEIDPLSIDALFGALPNLRSSLPPNLAVGGQVSARLEADGTWPGLAMSLRLDATEIELEAKPAGAAAAKGGGFAKKRGVPLTVAGTVTPSIDAVRFEMDEVAVHTMQATIRGETKLGEKPAYWMEIDTEPTQLADWRGFLPALEPFAPEGEIQLEARIEGAPPGKPKVEGTARIEKAGMTLPQMPRPVRDARAAITFDASSARIDDASLSVGDSRIDGSARVETFAPLVVSYEVRAKSIALLDVRPPNPAATKPEVLRDVKSTGRFTIGETPKGEGTVSAASGSMANFDFTNLRAGYAVDGKRTDISALEARTLDGTIKGSGTIRMEGDVPSFSVDTQARSLDLMPLIETLPAASGRYVLGGLTDFLHKGNVEGRANLDLTISGRGVEWEATRQTLGGTGVAEFVDGQLLDYNVFASLMDEIGRNTGMAALISQMVSQTVSSKYPRVFQSAGTQFEEFKSSFVIENGKLLARNLRLDAGDYVMSGSGTIDLTGQMDLQLTTVASAALTNDLVKSFQQAAYLKNDQGRIEIPFRVTGRYPDFSVKPDPGLQQKMLQGFSRDVLSDPSKAIKSLFGGKKSAPADTTKRR